MKRLLLLCLVALPAQAIGCGDAVQNSVVQPTATGLRMPPATRTVQPPPSLPRLGK
jgi:hypothetical protein